MKNIGVFYLKIFRFFGMNFSIYLNRRVFVMRKKKKTKLLWLLISGFRTDAVRYYNYGYGVRSDPLPHKIHIITNTITYQWLSDAKAK